MSKQNKNIGPFLAFDKEWFDKYQSALLWVLNNKITRRWARWILRIRKCDVGYKGIIVEIQPNNYKVFNGVDGDRLKLAAVFRTHPKYAKRIYYAFWPVWWTMHFWDWILADRLAPQLSFGFSTLTAYPDPSAGGTTVDGETYRSSVDQTLSAIRSSGGSASNAIGLSFSLGRLISSATANQYSAMYRGKFTFDTSSLSSLAVINSALFSVYGSSKTNGLGNLGIHIVGTSATNNNTVTSSDYPSVQSISFGSIAYGSYSSGIYNDISLDSNGITNISLTGISKFASRSDWDINNSFTGSWSASTQSYILCVSADQTGTSQDPKLTVDYTLPATGHPTMRRWQHIPYLPVSKSRFGVVYN